MYKLTGKSHLEGFPVLAVLQENLGTTLTLGTFRDYASAESWLDEVEDDFRIGSVLQLMANGDTVAASALLDAIMAAHPDHWSLAHRVLH